MKYDARVCKFNMDTGCVELLFRNGRINSTQAAVVVAVQVLFRTEKEKPEHKCALVFPGAVKQSKSEPFPFDAASAASPKVTVCVPSL